MSGSSEKIILYPREYNKRGESSLHSVMGMTQNGELVNIKLRIGEEFQGAKNPPSIQEFSRTDRKAKNPAIASPDNSPEKPEGIILFTGVHFEKEDRQREIKSYIASWAHVLREDSDSAGPHFGIGRIKVKKENTSTHIAIKNKLSSDISDGERSKLIDRLHDPKSYDYSVVFYLVKEQISFGANSSTESIKRRHLDIFDGCYQQGISFGYYRIICDNEMNPIPNRSREFMSLFSPINGDIDSPSDYLGKFKSRVDGEIGKHGGVILIPCYKLNPTSSSKSYYASFDRLEMIDSVFKNPEGYARVNALATKAVRLAGGRGVLFDRSHPLDYRRLNLDLLDAQENETRVYSSKMTLSHNNSVLDSIRVGLIDHMAFVRLSQSPHGGASPSETPAVDASPGGQGDQEPIEEVENPKEEQSADYIEPSISEAGYEKSLPDGDNDSHHHGEGDKTDRTTERAGSDFSDDDVVEGTHPNALDDEEDSESEARVEGEEKAETGPRYNDGGSDSVEVEPAAKSADDKQTQGSAEKGPARKPTGMAAFLKRSQ